MGSTGCLVAVVGQPLGYEHVDAIYAALAEGFASWNGEKSGIDINTILRNFINKNSPPEATDHNEYVLRSEDGLVSVLVNPTVALVEDTFRHMLTKPAGYNHVVYAGPVYQGSGAWILNDGTYSLGDLSRFLRNKDVKLGLQTVPDAALVVSTLREGEWGSQKAGDHFPYLTINPGRQQQDVSNSVNDLRSYLQPYLKYTPLDELLPGSDVIGNLRFNRPAFYIFPGGHGDSALFGVAGFTLLLDGGCQQSPVCWDFVRHLDRVDAVLVSRLNPGNVRGMSNLVERIAIGGGPSFPKIGYAFMNSVARVKDPVTPSNPLLVNIYEEGHRLRDSFAKLGLQPQPLLAPPVPVSKKGSPAPSALVPITLYSKVGHGQLDIYVLNPTKDSKELKDFTEHWQNQVFKGGSGGSPPQSDVSSAAALIVWTPSEKTELITRILYPGSLPKAQLFSALKRLGPLECVKSHMATSVPPAKPVKPPTSGIRHVAIPAAKAPPSKPLVNAPAKATKEPTPPIAKPGSPLAVNKPNEVANKTAVSPVPESVTSPDSDYLMEVNGSRDFRSDANRSSSSRPDVLAETVPSSGTLNPPSLEVSPPSPRPASDTGSNEEEAMILAAQHQIQSQGAFQGACDNLMDDFEVGHQDPDSTVASPQDPNAGGFMNGCGEDELVSSPQEYAPVQSDAPQDPSEAGRSSNVPMDSSPGSYIPDVPGAVVNIGQQAAEVALGEEIPNTPTGEHGAEMQDPTNDPKFHEEHLYGTGYIGIAAEKVAGTVSDAFGNILPGDPKSPGGDGDEPVVKPMVVHDSFLSDPVDVGSPTEQEHHHDPTNDPKCREDHLFGTGYIGIAAEKVTDAITGAAQNFVSPSEPGAQNEKFDGEFVGIGGGQGGSDIADQRLPPDAPTSPAGLNEEHLTSAVVGNTMVSPPGFESHPPGFGPDGYQHDDGMSHGDFVPETPTVVSKELSPEDVPEFGGHGVNAEHQFSGMDFDPYGGAQSPGQEGLPNQGGDPGLDFPPGFEPSMTDSNPFGSEGESSMDVRSQQRTPSDLASPLDPSAPPFQPCVTSGSGPVSPESTKAMMDLHSLNNNPSDNGFASVGYSPNDPSSIGISPDHFGNNYSSDHFGGGLNPDAPDFMPHLGGANQQFASGPPSQSQFDPMAMDPAMWAKAGAVQAANMMPDMMGDHGYHPHVANGGADGSLNGAYNKPPATEDLKKDWGEPLGMPPTPPVNADKPAQASSSVNNGKPGAAKSTGGRPKPGVPGAAAAYRGAPAKGRPSGVANSTGKPAGTAARPTGSASRSSTGPGVKPTSGAPGARKPTSTPPTAGARATRQPGSADLPKPSAAASRRSDQPRPLNNGAGKTAAGVARPTKESTTAKSTSRPATAGAGSRPSAVNGNATKSARTRPGVAATGTAKAAPTSAASSSTKRTSAPTPPTGSASQQPVPQLDHPYYFDLVYLPNQGDSRCADVDFFKSIRSKNYVLSGLNPSVDVLDAALAGKKMWDSKDAEMVIIPTYDSQTIGMWLALNGEELEKNHMDIAPSAIRCTLNLQDYNKSCAAYRLEF